MELVSRTASLKNSDSHPTDPTLLPSFKFPSLLSDPLFTTGPSDPLRPFTLEDVLSPSLRRHDVSSPILPGNLPYVIVYPVSVPNPLTDLVCPQSVCRDNRLRLFRPPSLERLFHRGPPLSYSELEVRPPFPSPPSPFTLINSRTDLCFD